MTTRTAKVTIAAFFFCCALGFVALRLARATPPVAVVNTLLAGPVSFGEINLTSPVQGHLVRIFAQNRSDVYVTEVTVAPGGQTGWHSHPGPAIACIKSGVATEYSGDDPTCTPIVHEAGTGFTEVAGEVHNVRNEGDEDLVLFVMFILPQGSKPRIDLPNPGNCPF